MPASLYERTCRALLDPGSAGDALTAYYLLLHPAGRSRRFLLRQDPRGRLAVLETRGGSAAIGPAGPADPVPRRPFAIGPARPATIDPAELGSGVLAICQTGLGDHPLVVLRCRDPGLAPLLIADALPSGTRHYFIADPRYRSFVEAALSDVGDKMETVILGPGPTTRSRASEAASGPVGDRAPRRADDGTANLRGPEAWVDNGRAGRRLVRGRIVVSSVAVLWQSGRFAEIGVSTPAPYRRRGYARAVVGALIVDLLNRGLTPLYTADQRNLPSLALAASLGLEPTGHEEFACSGRNRASTSPNRGCERGWPTGCDRTSPTSTKAT